MGLMMQSFAMSVRLLLRGFGQAGLLHAKGGYSRIA